jgi:diguanylate cyclase (GGDEF)-like protein
MDAGPASPVLARAADVFTDACVVIVGDRPGNAVVLEGMLRSVGVVDIHTVTDQREATSRCSAVAADLVLLSLQTPGTDAHQVLVELRAALQDGEFVPVVMVTADPSVETRDRALRAGANDVLTVPLDRTELILRARSLLETRALYIELRRGREQHLRRQRTILEVAAQVTGDLDLTALAKSIVEGVTSVTEFGAAVLTLRDGDGFERVATSGISEARIGLRTRRSQWQALLREDYRCGSLCYLIPPEDVAGDAWVQTIETPRPVRRPFDEREVWTPEHGLVLELLDNAGQWAGFLSVDAPSTGLLPDDETLQVLELFARQAQAGLENARLFALVRRERDVADALRTVGDALAGSLDLGEVLERCCDAVLAHSVGERANVYLHDSGRFRAVMNCGAEPDPDLWRAFRALPPATAADTPVFADAIRTGEPVLVSHVAAPTHVRPEALELFSLKSLAAYPLRSGDRTVGILLVDAHTRHVEFPEQEVRLVARIAGQAAVAIHQAQLHQEAKRHAARVGVLHELTKAMTRTFDVDAIFTRITEALPKSIVWLLEPGDQHLRVLHTNAPREGEQATIPYDIPRGSLPVEVWDQLSRPDPLVVPDIRATPLGELAAPDVRAVLAVGHRDDDGRQLVLALTSDAPEAFDADDVAFAEGLVETAALAQRNARLYTEVKHAAERDALTGLKNRRVYQAELTPLLAAASYTAPVAMAVLDVDNFKRINDHRGHDVGDQVLVHVADRLRRSLREDDEVYRIGGEEFAIVMPGAGPAEAAAVAERIRRNVAATRTDVPTATVSVGIAVAPGHGTDIDALFRVADRALYDAKAAGKDTVRIAAAEG